MLTDTDVDALCVAYAALAHLADRVDEQVAAEGERPDSGPVVELMGLLETHMAYPINGGSDVSFTLRDAAERIDEMVCDHD